MWSRTGRSCRRTTAIPAEAEDGTGSTGTVLCPGCGAFVPSIAELRTAHVYVGAAPGCWAAYTKLIGRQLTEQGLAEARMLSVDVYMAQHPGVPGRQASQSVWVHLIGLCLALEHGFDGAASARAKARAAAPDAIFDWLEPPASFGPITVLDVLATVTAGEHRAAVQRWAISVWSAWAPYEDQIRKRARDLLGGGRCSHGDAGRVRWAGGSGRTAGNRGFRDRSRR